jgi:hypothetical protein
MRAFLVSFAFCLIVAVCAGLGGTTNTLRAIRDDMGGVEHTDPALVDVCSKLCTPYAPTFANPQHICYCDLTKHVPGVEDDP